jgi:S-adenosylmethionine synthetase
MAAEHGFETSELGISCADDLISGDVYLTVKGTSAEAGHAGEVGRGKRANGLITPTVR